MARAPPGPTPSALCPFGRARLVPAALGSASGRLRFSARVRVSPALFVSARRRSALSGTLDGVPFPKSKFRVSPPYPWLRANTNGLSLGGAARKTGGCLDRDPERRKRRGPIRSVVPAACAWTTHVDGEERTKRSVCGSGAA